MKPSPKYSIENMENSFQIYSILQNYYSGSWLQKEEEWEKIREFFVSQNYHLSNPEYKKGISLLVPFTEEAVYDFNKLFVGPGKLLAPPYEGAYRNREGLLMQEETLRVRDFYLSVGLAVEKKNTLPDDFLGLELEFICYLLFNAAEKMAKNDLVAAEYYLNKYTDFFLTHLSRWIFNHCQDVLTFGSSQICRGMALITKGFLQWESELIHEIEGGKINEQ